MKISIKLLLTTTLVLMLSACNTKTNNEETNSNAVSSPATETTEESSVNSGVSTIGTSAVANHGGTTASNTGSSSHVQSTAEENANNGTTNHTNVNDNSGASTGTSTNSNNANNDSVGSGSEDTTDATGTSNDNNATSNNGNATGNDQNHTGGTDSNGTEVVDTTPPVITLHGEATMTLAQNAVYTELGAIALDGNVSVITTGNVDTSTVGSYTVTYSATDSAGNEANITRAITIIDVTPPVITLNGQANVSLSVGESYVELGATAVDTVDGNVSVNISGTVDTNTAGTYTITYTATDSVGNEANVTRNVIVVAPTFTSITLESNVSTLNIGEKATLTLLGTYPDNSTEVLTKNIEYIITPSQNVELNASTLTVLKDGTVTLQAKVGTLLSNTLTLNIEWVVNGHVLPPEPDKALNDSTLLGIDSNNNGVRDDVERYIYNAYKQPIEKAVFMQLAKALQSRVGHAEEAWKYRQPISDAIACLSYWTVVVEYIGLEKYEIHAKTHKSISRELDFIQFNTELRKIDEDEYQKALSGGVIEDNGLRARELIQKCNFKSEELMKDYK